MQIYHGIYHASIVDLANSNILTIKTSLQVVMMITLTTAVQRTFLLDLRQLCWAA